VTIRLATAQDAAAIAAIYAPYVTGSAISFETEPPSVAEMAARIDAGGALYPWFVACDGDGKVLGHASAGAFRSRRAYRFSVETSVYLDPEACGRGIGERLYRHLLATLEAQGFTQAIGAITLPNPASVALHEKLGFRQSGVYQDVGFKLGQWRSVGLWQRPLAPLAAAPEEPRPFAALIELSPSPRGSARTG
jgi:phosphinothricin acetyltransferase